VDTETVGPAGAEADAVTVTDLFRAHHLELVRFALVLTGDLATAEDVVQDVFERLHRRWPDLRERTGLSYAMTSVLNGCRSAARRDQVRRRHANALVGRPSAGADAASAVADRGALAAALRSLPGRQREVIVLRYYCDLDVAEIARMLGIGPSTVRSAVSRGLAALASAVGEEDR